MRDSIFLDSNIFLYSFSSDDEIKHDIASIIVLSQNHNLVISPQVINEVSNNMLKKLDFNNTDVEDFIKDSYKRFQVVDLSREVFLKACDIRDSHKISKNFNKRKTK